MDAPKDDNKQDNIISAENGNMKLQIRTARVQKFISVDENISIKDLRAKAAETFEVGEPSLAVLIFGGKILKDTEDIKTHGIKDGQTIHLVIRNKPSGDESNSTNYSNHQTSQQPTITNAPNNANDSTIPNQNRQDAGLANNPLLGNLGEVQQRLQQMLISSPEAMQNMINPMMQQMMTNPSEMLRSLFGSMQRMQVLMERNPEVNHLLSNPDVLRESLEMVRNPAALQEVMRNYDRALNNMESMPGGYNVLRRMYTEFQEPLQSAFQEQFNNNQFSSSQTNPDSSANDSENNSSETEQQRTENRDPLPNPWAPQSSPTNRPQFPATGGGATGASGGVNLAGLTGLAGLSNLVSDTNNTNGSTQQDSGMLNQEIMSLLTNPEAIQSVEQIHHGFERLQRIVPNLFNSLGFPQNLPRIGSGAQNGNTNQSCPLTSGTGLAQMFGQILGNNGINSSNNGAQTDTGTRSEQSNNQSGAAGQANMDAARMLAQLLGNQGTAGAGIDTTMGPVVGPQHEEQYSQQLQQLTEMGFTNRDANLRALIAAFGDINAAIARLLPQ